jgi:hypothetical protein
MSHDKEFRDRINKQLPKHHALSRLILNLDWHDTESQARRVIEWIVEEDSKRQGANKNG